jgi:hypothetical protein
VLRQSRLIQFVTQPTPVRSKTRIVMPLRTESLQRKMKVRLLFLVIGVITVACDTGKQKGNKTRTTTSAPPAQATASQQEKNAGSARPALAEVKEAVQRVYINTVDVDAARTEPFVIGDFNGDGSQDLAVIARPTAGALAKLNSEYANWIIEDPRTIVPPDPQKAVQELPKSPPRPKIGPDDLLLLVLHGYKEQGWRHLYARQTFLLKNSVGENIRAESFKELSKESNGKIALARLSGDVVRENLAGEEGFLYWTNGKYVWRR